MSAALRAAGRFARRHHLGGRKRPVELIEPMPSPPVRLAATTASHLHRNWLARDDYQLPLDRFGIDPGPGSVDLIDAVETAVAGITHDGITVVRPIGSVTYARRDGEIVWELVRDLDLWCLVSAATVAASPLADLTSDIVDALHDEFESRGLRCRMSRRGNLTICEPGARPRLVEVKVADMAWLLDGLAHMDERDLSLKTPRKPPYVKAPRLEWAAYTGYENYYASAVAEERLADLVGSISAPTRAASTEYAYRDNLAVGLRELRPARVARAVFHQYRFARHAMKVLKVILVLAVMFGDVELRDRAVDELHRVRSREVAWTGPAHRLSYLSRLMEELDRLLVVAPDRFLSTTMATAGAFHAR